MTVGRVLKGVSTSPFYDIEFVTGAAKPARKKKNVPVIKRTVERWICDRCGAKGEFPDTLGQSAAEVGWIRLDLTRTLDQQKGRYLFGKNVQVLCPDDVDRLAIWFDHPKGD